MQSKPRKKYTPARVIKIEQDTLDNNLIPQDQIIHQSLRNHQTESLIHNHISLDSTNDLNMNAASQFSQSKFYSSSVPSQQIQQHPFLQSLAYSNTNQQLQSSFYPQIQYQQSFINQYQPISSYSPTQNVSPLIPIQQLQVYYPQCQGGIYSCGICWFCRVNNQSVINSQSEKSFESNQINIANQQVPYLSNTQQIQNIARNKNTKQGVKSNIEYETDSISRSSISESSENSDIKEIGIAHPLLTHIPERIRELVHQKNARFLLTYIPILNSLPTQKRFRGHFKANINEDRMTGWIKSFDFPDNVQCDLHLVNNSLILKQSSSLMQLAGMPVEFGIQLNIKPQSFFEAIDVKQVLPNEQPQSSSEEAYSCKYYMQQGFNQSKSRDEGIKEQVPHEPLILQPPESNVYSSVPIDDTEDQKMDNKTKIPQDK